MQITLHFHTLWLDCSGFSMTCCYKLKKKVSLQGSFYKLFCGWSALIDETLAPLQRIPIWTLHVMNYTSWVISFSSHFFLSAITALSVLLVFYQRSRFVTWSRNAGHRVNTTTSCPKSCWISVWHQIPWTTLRLIPHPHLRPPSRRSSHKSSSDLKHRQTQVGYCYLLNCSFK